ncbi:FAD-dependent pyridine nucleotide-disulfide oxidoreductase [hydrothermal vent metagenome]|uniref:FAD-dependent pyridine nucleotide-disulfide oxidoreductase n=1 Tax=hydrothermal vent metagenome TaxID=652676 RepID=A0A3B1DUK3_9ZZZZ
MKKYDVIVIGSGGGAKIISPAVRLGLKVACIEKSALGGTCLNRGCIPSKMLIHPADVATKVRHAHKLNLDIDQTIGVDFAQLIKHISTTVDTDSSSIAAGYDRNPNIDYYSAEGKFVSNKVIQVGNEQITADKIFIAVGARPHIPNIEGLEGTPYMTSTEALRNNKLPKKMIVIGAGYIAVELGHAYGALGTEVHFLVRSRFLKGEDVQVAEEFTDVFAEQYNVHLGSVPTRVDYNNNRFSVIYRNQDGTTEQLSAEALLVATGIVSNTDTLALENTDIELKEKGLVKVDDYLRTSVEGIYAMGDCVGNYFFRHSVNFEGEYLFNQVFKDVKTPIQYPPIPHAVFSYPQIAGVGKTEEELQADGVDYVVGLNLYKSSAMGMALRSDHGFCKILIERTTRKILGAHIVGEEASDMIHMIIAFMNKEGTLDDLLNMIYIHPALPEIVRNAARKAEVNFNK